MIMELRRGLSEHFSGLDSRTVLCLSQVICGLIQLRTVNLTELALVVQRQSQVFSSNYRRLQRFFERLDLDAALFAKIMIRFCDKKDWVLCLDRTNWKFGKADINILVLAIAHKNIAIPVLWCFIPHRGNSNLGHRKAILKRFIDLFGTARMRALTADREFVGNAWFSWLKENNIPFVIRIKSKMKIGRKQGELTTANHLINALKPGEIIVLEEERWITDQPDRLKLFVSACNNSDGKLVIVLSNKDGPDALDIYKRRWEIESLFGCLKTRGFNFEETHMCHEKKVNNLLIALSLAFVWSYKVGEWKNELTPIKLKAHKRKAHSLFRYGMDLVRQSLLGVRITELDRRLIEKVLEIIMTKRKE